MKPIVAPSILAADWGVLNQEVSRVVEAGADWIHIDVMDGHFVPPLTFGPQMVQAIRKRTDLPLDVHLMIERPENQIQSFAAAGADIITVHVEACPHLHRVVQQIHELGKQAGVAVNPATSLELAAPILPDIDLLLLMTVNPGWGGQKFIEGSGKRIELAAGMIRETGRKIHLEVDGGINQETGRAAAGNGAGVLVAGTFVFGAADYRRPIAELHDV